MADLKLSQLSALTGLSLSDLIEVLDVSDTSMSADGTNKKVTLSTLADFLSSGRELGFAESSSSQTTTSTATDGEAFSPAITTGSIAVGSRPIIVEGLCEYVVNGTDNSNNYLVLMQDSTNIGNAFFRCSEANDFGLVVIRRRLSLTPGNYTFSLNKKVSAGTATYMQFGYKVMLQVREC